MANLLLSGKNKCLTIRSTSAVQTNGESNGEAPLEYMETIIETKNLRVDYRAKNSGNGKKIAVNNLNLKVQAGEVFGFLGPNGAGKTTTMNVLLGFTNATEGNAFLFGVNVREPIARQRIGYLPELTYY